MNGVRSQLNLHYLRIFHAVATEGSVTRAAERLAISQPAVSLQVKRLEDELGFPLLQAQGRGIALTEAGRDLAEYASRLFGLEAEIDADFARRREGLSGILRVGATNSPGQYLLPRWVSLFKQQLPGVEVHIHVGNSRGVFTALHQREVDVALMAGGWAEPGIDKEVLFMDELCFVVAAGHPLAGQTVTLPDLAREPFVVREAGSSTRVRLFGLFETCGLSPRIGLVFSGMQETARAVESGYGVALLPTMAAGELIAAGRLGRVTVPGAHLPFPISLCTRSGEPLAPTARRFAETIREVCTSTLG